MYNPLYDNASEAECVGVSCTRDAEDIELLVMNEKMMQVDKPASLGFSNCTSSPNYCVDIAGYCDLGGYPQSVLSYTINGPAGLSVPQTTSQAKCDETGRFQMQIVLPANYQFDQFLNVEIFLQAIDEEGYTVENPRGSNVQKLTIWGM